MLFTLHKQDSIFVLLYESQVAINRRKHVLCRYDGRLIKCDEMLKAEAIVVDSCARERREIEQALEFINRHMKEVMQENK